MSTATKPNEILQALLAGLSGLSGVRVSQDTPADFGGFPLLIWRNGRASGPTDAEQWLYLDDTVTIDVFGADQDQLEDIKASLDAGLNNACHGGSLDTSEWRVKTIRRTTKWRRIPWRDRQDTTGNVVIQWQAEWAYHVLRKQNA